MCAAVIGEDIFTSSFPLLEPHTTLLLLQWQRAPCGPLWAPLPRGRELPLLVCQECPSIVGVEVCPIFSCTY